MFMLLRSIYVSQHRIFIHCRTYFYPRKKIKLLSPPAFVARSRWPVLCRLKVGRWLLFDPLDMSADYRFTDYLSHTSSARLPTTISYTRTVDISVEDPPIEAVIDQVYREGVWL